ncbi:hypothetical protein OAN307_c09900 [Octadecabacter antarcticus 307]|uniref:Uncharacterized protein n=1 Tax=Octadecabacter antarcticus 307 TaxID=391626 RepID=M9RAC3_9RHOB|nr:hypothetical protein [Octadecabacter antarcticus]AGI66705.1 hypothetical protein OAN307_c09900 [Octadecabacter antarcticus 307]
MYARQCLSMGRIALQAVHGAAQTFAWDFPYVVSIYVYTVGCLHDYYDLLEGASVYDTEEVVERLNEDRNLGEDLASDLMRTFGCLPEDLQDILVDDDTDDDVTYVMEHISSDERKCR